MTFADIRDLVGRPVPDNASARDVILWALADGTGRPLGDKQDRLALAMPSLLEDGLVIRTGEIYSLAPGAGDAASGSRMRVIAARRERARWGRELQDALASRRDQGKLSSGMVPEGS